MTPEESLRDTLALRAKCEYAIRKVEQQKMLWGYIGDMRQMFVLCVIGSLFSALMPIIEWLVRRDRARCEHFKNAPTD